MNSIGAQSPASTPSTHATARPCHASHSPAAAERHAARSSAGPSPISPPTDSPASTASSQASRSAIAIAAPNSAT
ncbi:hypothetical protein [Novosphingobium clariflavum]|uniref:Uncharacterized protein n=1 Tax=Novosphingobium clariflavum TaxID=2029884 RepID=A0ABV6SC24_9SPHN|nr:hypothetical protein [Novosphingobium clariflavum]